MAVNLLKPPRAWFDDPHLKMPTPLTVSRDGRVVGHLAAWKTSHTAFPGHHIKPPRSRAGYAYFHTGQTDTDTGDMVPIGRLTVNTGHASLGDDAATAASHYDNTGTAAAVVRAGEDRHGIWIAGAVTPDATQRQIAALRRSPLSGDWRTMNGSLELIGALAVNVPGFPVAVTASANAGVLIAAGCLPAAVPQPSSAVSDILRRITHETRLATLAALTALEGDADVWLRRI